MRILLFILIVITFCFSCKNEKTQEQTEVQVNDSGIYYYDSLISFAELNGILIPQYLKRLNGYANYTFADNVKINFSPKNNSGLYPYDISLLKIGKNIDEKFLPDYIISNKDEVYRLIISRWFSQEKHIFRIHYQLDSLSEEPILFLKIKTCHNRTDSLIKEETIKITIQQWNKFKEKLDYADFWGLGEDRNDGTDGTMWVLSGTKFESYSRRKKLYLTVGRWVPERTAFRDAAAYIVELYDKKLLEEYLKNI